MPRTIKKESTEFELFYHISNNGDGSVSLQMHSTEKQAAKADQKMDEGWGEPCNGSVRLKLEDNKIFYEDFDEESYEKVWKKAKMVK